MFSMTNPRFRGVDKKRIRSEEHLRDYEAAERYGRVRFGELCFYYKDLGKKYIVPYDYIQRAYLKMETVQPDDSPAYYYYRMILIHGEKEFANLIFDKEELIRAAFTRLQERVPAMTLGPLVKEKRR